MEALLPDEPAFPLALATAFSVFVKYAVGLWGYSGHATPPLYGDYEAQRHWMEITVNLPLHRWYRYDLPYWGLDYPPLTAYVSWCFGHLAKLLCPNMVELDTSRGIETPESRLFMRGSVLLSDLLIYVPSVVLLASLIRHPMYSTNNSLQTAVKLTLLLLTPSMILIDHGHFQYNCVSIGLSLLGAYFLLQKKDFVGSILFCCGLNFKQMILYYAPVFVFVLLRKCFRQENSSFITYFTYLGLVVILTFGILWSPFCIFHSNHETCTEALLQVFHRIFPFNRGIFEDKVANLWYVASVVFDYRTVFTIEVMAKMSLALTLLMLSPIGFNLLVRRITPLRFSLALTNSALVRLHGFRVLATQMFIGVLPSIFPSA